MHPKEAGLSRPKRILAVDDQRVTLLVVRRILMNAGLEADTAANPEEALLRLREKEYDLVLLDIGIPGSPVEETVRRVREQRPKAVVLLMTGGASQFEVERARALGAVGPVLKPFEPKTLVEAVRSRL
ncbi:MAG: response regulator [Elusimicrobiota bacterium]